MLFANGGVSGLPRPGWPTATQLFTLQLDSQRSRSGPQNLSDLHCEAAQLG